MMKFLKKCIFFLIPFFLIGCADGSSDLKESSSGTVKSWNEKEKNVLQNSLGDYYNIPLFEADTYYSQNIENNGVTLAVINCFDGFDESTAEFIYTTKLKEEGYQITDAREEESCIYGIKIVVEDQLAVVMQYAYREEYRQMQRYSYFAIVTYLYENTKQINPTYDVFPKNEVYGFLGENIPSYDDASSYEVVHDITINNNPTIDIYCYNAKDDADTVYKKTLENAGYTLEDVGNVLIATKENSDINIWFYMAYDNMFFIRAYHADVVVS